MIASAKVLRRDQFDDTMTVFPENHRPERIVSDAIKYFHQEYRSRVFNISIGNPDDIYTGGRQFAWAEVLDQLARELDVLIITSAGNISTPPLPNSATTREGFQVELRDLILASPQCRLCSPATASIVITVGALARSERSERHSLAGAPAGAPAPFSRVGPGYAPKETQGAIKPEFVAFGGNFAVRNWDSRGPAWVRNDIQLGEPTTRLNSDGDRVLTSACGTSFAAPHVSFASAIALQAAARTLGNTSPSANSARALLGSCTHIPSCGAEWLLDPAELESWEKMRLGGIWPG
jgi:Subtilase family.